MNDNADKTAQKTQILAPASVLLFPQKLNVHFELIGDLYRACVKVNRAILERGQSEISFVPPSFQKPHLTLAMGYVEEENQFLEIVTLLQVFADSTRAAEYTFTSPYAKAPHRRYIFSDAIQREEILGLKELLNSFDRQDSETTGLGCG